MLGLIPIIRAIAVVGVSAVSIVSAALRVKNGETGPINQDPNFNNSASYNCQTGDVNMYNTTAFGSQSRRFGYGYNQMPTMPQPMMAGPMMGQNFVQRPLSFGVASYQPNATFPQQTMNQYGYQSPAQNPMMNSRRNCGYNFNSQVFMQQQFQQAPTYFQQPQMNTGNTWWQQYNTPVNDGTQSLYTDLKPMNNSYGFGYADTMPTPPQPPQQMMFDPYQQQFQQPMMNPNAYMDWNNDPNWTPGCGARKEYSVAFENAYGHSGSGYFGYDERMPSYPQQPMQPMMTPPPQMMPNMAPPMQQPMQQPYPSPMEQIMREQELQRMRAMQQQQMVSPLEQLKREQEMRLAQEWKRQQQMQTQPQMNTFPNESFSTIKPFNMSGSNWFDRPITDTFVPQSDNEPQHVMPQPGMPTPADLHPITDNVPPSAQPTPPPQPQPQEPPHPEGMVPITETMSEESKIILNKILEQSANVGRVNEPPKPQQQDVNNYKTITKFVG